MRYCRISKKQINADRISLAALLLRKEARPPVFFDKIPYNSCNAA